MEQTIPQNPTKTQSDAEYIAAIEEMEHKIALSFARMDEIESQTQKSMERTDAMLTRIEEAQAASRR